MAKYCGEDFICIVTGQPNADLHHIKTQKSGGTDDGFNLIPISHAIHEEWHKQGTGRMAEKYPFIKQWLLNQGWYFCPVRKKWSH